MLGLDVEQVAAEVYMPAASSSRADEDSGATARPRRLSRTHPG